MLGTPVRTLAYLFNRVKTRFGKTTPELEAQFLLDITDELRVICAEYPYWFLRFDPGGTVPQNFVAGTTPTVAYGDWCDSGWFRTTADQIGYAAWSPHFQLPQPNGWAMAEISQINYAKVYSSDGTCLKDLKVLNGDVFHSYMGYTETGTPNRIMPRTVGNQTTFWLAPIPDQTYYVAMGAQLAYPPWFQVGNSWTNPLLAYYPRVMYHLGMMYFAEYFQEVQLYEWHKTILYGKMRGSTRSDNPDYGLIGAMKMDSERREMQQTPDMVYGESVKDLVGRSERSHLRRPGGAYYVDEW